MLQEGSGRKEKPVLEVSVVTQLGSDCVSATITVRIFIIFGKISKTSQFRSRTAASILVCAKKIVIRL